MCKQGTMVTLDIPAHPDWVRNIVNGRKKIDVDGCISDLVHTLNDNGFSTEASCCGHNNRPGNIALTDGRELIIVPDYNSARIAERAFPNIQGEWSTEENRLFAERTREEFSYAT